jgi:hypothetical protein
MAKLTKPLRQKLEPLFQRAGLAQLALDDAWGAGDTDSAENASIALVHLLTEISAQSGGFRFYASRRAAQIRKLRAQQFALGGLMTHASTHQMLSTISERLDRIERLLSQAAGTTTSVSAPKPLPRNDPAPPSRIARPARLDAAPLSPTRSEHAVQEARFEAREASPYAATEAELYRQDGLDEDDYLAADQRAYEEEARFNEKDIYVDYGSREALEDFEDYFENTSEGVYVEPGERYMG